MARVGAGLSQNKLGEMLSPPRSHVTISNIERGVQRLNTLDLLDIAKATGQSIGFFFPQNGAEPHD